MNKKVGLRSRRAVKCRRRERKTAFPFTRRSRNAPRRMPEPLFVRRKRFRVHVAKYKFVNLPRTFALEPMKITGHTSPAVLKKYIRTDELQVVDKIKGKYNYFD